MNIPKAIKILVHYDDPLRLFTIKETKAAVRLGIEALEYLERWRAKAEIQVFPLLPSETTD